MQLTDKYFKIEEERLHRFNYYKGIDCRQMMKEFAVECNTLNYHLKRLVADKDSHQVLAPRRTEVIDVIPDTYMFFKVVTRDMHAPGKLHFGYGEGQYVRSSAPKRMGTMQSIESAPPASPLKRPGDLQRTKVELNVYFSINEKNKEPTKEFHDKHVENPNGSITMPILGKDRFENDEVYVSLHSLIGCTVNLTVTFPDLKIQNFSRKIAKEDYAEEGDFDNYLVCKNWKKQCRNKGNEKDCFIRENVVSVTDYEAIRIERASRLGEHRELMKKEQTRRKKAEDEFDHKMKYFKLHRWAIIRHYREEKEEQARIRLSIKKRAKQLIIKGRTYMIIKDIYQRYEKMRDQVRRQIMMDQNSRRIAKVFRARMENLTHNYKDRCLKFSKQIGLGKSRA